MEKSIVHRSLPNWSPHIYRDVLVCLLLQKLPELSDQRTLNLVLYSTINLLADMIARVRVPTRTGLL